MDAVDWADLKRAFAELTDLEPEERAFRLARLSRERPALAERLGALLEADASADARLRRLEGALRGADHADAPAASDPLGLAGRTIGPFVIETVLGSGGMGVAYLARDTRLDRAVALKFLLPRQAMPADATTLLHEARAASALDHPNVCTVFEVGEAEPGLFFAMPAYSGETLRQRLARSGRLDVDEAVALATQLLRGLTAAHAAGITHRDLKPGNLMVTRDGTLKILDFGLATIRDLHGADVAGTPGTMAYMSPEQLGAGEADERTDLWSAGVVLYEMLTGANPFGSGNALATPWSILHDPTPAPGVSPALDGFVLRLLSKDPADRPASAADALAELENIAVAASRGGVLRRAGMRRLLAAAAIIALVSAAWSLLSDGGGDDGRPPSIAVLRFADASQDRSQSYLAEGFAEDLLDLLAHGGDLRVPGRRSSFALDRDSVPPAGIARLLGVDHLVDGSVEQVGDRVRGSARLVEASTGVVLWSYAFDRPLREIFALRTEMADAIAGALAVGHHTRRQVLPVRDPAAYELYLRGRFHWHRRTARDLAQAIDFFRQATALDSLFAAPWAGLALAWAVLPPLTGGQVELLDSAEHAAARALALDSTLSDAHAARGYARHWQWRWLEGEAELRRAVALDPSSSTAHQWLGEHLAKMGRGEEGERLLRRAIELDPLSLVARNDLGIVLMLGRRHEEAIAQFRDVSALDPSFALPLLLLHRTLLMVGEAEAAAEAGRRNAELSGLVDPAEVALLARATRDTALLADAFDILDAWQRTASPRWVDIAMYYCLLGEEERALDALERAVDTRAPMIVQIRASAWADPLRDDPRFRAILERLAFP